MVYVITAVHNRKAISEQFIQSLLRQTYKDIHLVIVDDGSTDGTSDMVRQYMPEATIIHGNGNLWWGGACHKAYKWINKLEKAQNSEFVMFANDDTHFAADYIESAIRLLEKYHKTLVTGVGYSIYSGSVIDGAVVVDISTATIIEMNIIDGIGNCCSTRSLFLRVKDVKRIGGFHPLLLPHYGSDYEWTIRACRRKNYKVIADSSLHYMIDETTTGNNTYEKLNLNKVFSKRSVTNPFYRMTFIMLTTPLCYWHRAIVKQLWRYHEKADVIKTVMKRERK